MTEDGKKARALGKMARCHLFSGNVDHLRGDHLGLAPAERTVTEHLAASACGTRQHRPAPRVRDCNQAAHRGVGRDGGAGSQGRPHARLEKIPARCHPRREGGVKGEMGGALLNNVCFYRSFSIFVV